MLKDSFLRELTPEYASELLQERQEFTDKSRRALPRIIAKKAKYPNWWATCPKSGCLLTLDDIKEELQAYLEEAEEEIVQLEKHLNPTVSPQRTNSKPMVKQLELSI